MKHVAILIWRHKRCIAEWNTIIIWGEAIHERGIIWLGIMLECSGGTLHIGSKYSSLPWPQGLLGVNRFALEKL